MDEQGQSGPNQVKWGQTGPNGALQAEMVSNRAKQGQMGQTGPIYAFGQMLQIHTNVAKQDQKGQNQSKQYLLSLIYYLLPFNPHQTGVSESLIRRGGAKWPPPINRANNGFCKFCFYRGLYTYIKG